MTKTPAPKTETAKMARMVNEAIATKPRRTRAAVKTLNKAPADVAANAAAEKARKAASKKALADSRKAASKKALADSRKAEKALADSRKAEKAPEVKPLPVVQVVQVVQVPTPDQLAEKAARDHAAYLDALRVDAAALGRDPEEYIAEQTAPAPKTGKYHGPMLALRAAAKSYVKAKNGQPCNGDELAMILGGLTRGQTVEILGALLFNANVTASTNPYLHLNAGQQSMNLRNKFRGALKNGLVTLTGLQMSVNTWIETHTQP